MFWLRVTTYNLEYESAPIYDGPVIIRQYCWLYKIFSKGHRDNMGGEDMSSNYSQVFRKNTFLYISHVFFILNHAKCLLLANSIEHSLLIGLSTVHELLPVASCFLSYFLFPTVPSLSKSALFARPVLTQCGLMCWCHLLWHLLLSSMLWLISNNQRSCAYFNRRACLGSKIQLRA